MNGLNKKYYAGVGARDTPEDVLEVMEQLGAMCSDAGWTLRSGGAEGADTAFETGHGNGDKEIFLPWGKFNGNNSKLFKSSDDAYTTAKALLPYWDKLQQGPKHMHARNMHIIAGQFLNEPVDFMICWTKDGTIRGGTGVAIMAATVAGIPIFNLGSKDFDEEAQDRLLALISGE